jgi:hypothetical protein
MVHQTDRQTLPIQTSAKGRADRGWKTQESGSTNRNPQSDLQTSGALGAAKKKDYEESYGNY